MLLSSTITPRETTFSERSKPASVSSRHFRFSKDLTLQSKFPNIYRSTELEKDASTYNELPNLLQHRVMLSESIHRIRTIIPLPTTTPFLSPFSIRSIVGIRFRGGPLIGRRFIGESILSAELTGNLLLKRGIPACAWRPKVRESAIQITISVRFRFGI